MDNFNILGIFSVRTFEGDLLVKYNARVKAVDSKQRTFYVKIFGVKKQGVLYFNVVFKSRLKTHWLQPGALLKVNYSEERKGPQVTQVHNYKKAPPKKKKQSRKRKGRRRRK